MEGWIALLIFLTFGFTISLCALSDSEGYSCENSRGTNLQNRICTNYLLWKVTGIRHSQCLLKCLSDNQRCQAVFYNAVNGKCQGHSSFMTSQDNCTAEDGAKYYHKCTDKPCPFSPPFVNHAYAVIKINKTQQVAEYACNPGYWYAGGETNVKCDHDLGQWSETTLRCTDKPCPFSPPFVEHAYAVVIKVNKTQQVAEYACNPGYWYAGGENKVKCDHDFGQWGETTLRCTDCFNVPTYKGTKSKTQGDIECQRWDSQSPHMHTYNNPEYFPEKSITAAENYCRAFDYTEPWCYTTNPNIRWDSSGIPQCYRALENDCGPPSLLTRKYANVTQYLNYTTYSAFASYRCDAFSDLTFVEYCPVSVCTKLGWSAASVSCGEQDCVINSSLYRGKRNCTVSGLTCQRWNSEYPHTHEYTKATFPDGSATDAGNYCRDPSGYGTTWCYTMDPRVSWEVCDVPSCD